MHELNISIMANCVDSFFIKKKTLTTTKFLYNDKYYNTCSCKITNLEFDSNGC